MTTSRLAVNKNIRYIIYPFSVLMHEAGGYSDRIG